MPKLSKRPLLLSLILHGCLIAVLLYFLHHAILYSLPQKNAVVLNAYLPKVHQDSQQHSKSTPILNTSASTPLRSPDQKTPAKMAEAKPLQSTQPLATQEPASATQPQRLAPKQVQKLLVFISKQIQMNLQYPEAAKTHIEQGESIIQFELMPNGKLQDIQIVRSSGNTNLDQAALTAVRASSPVKFPNSLSLREALTLRIPVMFHIQSE